jgi:anti-sigma factor RsiW
MTAMAKPELGHRSDEITSYLSETLEPEERAKLEAHLDTCEECQSEVEAQKALFSQVNEVLAVKPKRTIDEQVARFEKIVAQERAQAVAVRRRRLRWELPLGIAVAAALAAMAVIAWHGASTRPDRIMAAPRKP